MMTDIEKTEPSKSDGWNWWGGVSDEACIYGPLPTKEDVIAAAVADGSGEFQAEDGTWKVGIYICEARQDPLMLADWIMAADELIEHADEAVGDSDRASENDDLPYFDCTRAQQDDLELRIKAACNEWQAAHGRTFKTWTFSASRNHERLVVEPKEPTP